MSVFIFDARGLDLDETVKKLSDELRAASSRFLSAKTMSPKSALPHAVSNKVKRDFAGADGVIAFKFEAAKYLPLAADLLAAVFEDNGFPGLGYDRFAEMTDDNGQVRVLGVLFTK